MFLLNLQEKVSPMMNRPFLTLVYREVWRFVVLYKQTIMPGIISTALYLVIFGHALGNRIGLINNVEYIHFIIPGLTMMAVINQSYANSSSSIMQAKFLRFIEDILITPLSGFEISLAYIIGATFRGVINGLVVFALSWVLADFSINNYIRCAWCAFRFPSRGFYTRVFFSRSFSPFSYGLYYKYCSFICINFISWSSS